MDTYGHVISLCIGAGLVSFVIMSLLGSLIVQHIWSFIDETPKAKYNYVGKLICKLWGYSLSGLLKDGRGWSTYVKQPKKVYFNSADKNTDGVEVYINSCLILFFTPITIWSLIQFYPITLTIALVISIIILSRFSRRTFKRLVKHEVDTTAHTDKNVNKDANDYSFGGVSPKKEDDDDGAPVGYAPTG